MLAKLLITGEVAERLCLSPRRVRTLIQSGRLPARKATKEELAMLLTTGRLTLVTCTSVWLVHEQDLEMIKERHPGRPKKVQ